MKNSAQSTSALTSKVLERLPALVMAICVTQSSSLCSMTHTHTHTHTACLIIIIIWQTHTQSVTNLWCVSDLSLFVLSFEDWTLWGFLSLCLLDSLKYLFSLFPQFPIFTNCSTLLRSSHLFQRLFSFAYFMLLILPFCVFFFNAVFSLANILQTLHIRCLFFSPLCLLRATIVYCPTFSACIFLSFSEKTVL